MPARTAAGPHTFEDFCFLVKESEKADLIDGEIYMASPDSTDANETFRWLGALMDFFAEVADAGKVYGARVALRLDARNGPEPDIAFVRKARLHLVQRDYIAGPADLTLEIVSPESIERDYIVKRRLYEHAGVAEYWIVDEMMGKVTLLRLGPGGKYREVKPRKGELHSEALPGFWLRPEWLWNRPRPKKADVLAQLMARWNG